MNISGFSVNCHRLANVRYIFAGNEHTWREMSVRCLFGRHLCVWKCFVHTSSCLKEDMIGQRKISSFFSTNSVKRPIPESVDDQNFCKKAKTSTDAVPAQNDSVKKVDTTPKATMLTGIGPTWMKALRAEFEKPYFLKLSKFLEEERAKYTVYPPPSQVFTWTRACEIHDVKVVILGQDPYHGPRQAHGLCFSVQRGIAPPPSLENMFKELQSDIEGFTHPGHGMLIGWAEQGVLLLNACLTVRAGNANSHAGKGWEMFTDAVISWLNKNLSGVVFLLWGAYAQKKGACINTKRHHILKSVHPSPLSAHRGFFGCKHFSQCNKLLKDQHKKPIDWKHLPVE